MNQANKGFLVDFDQGFKNLERINEQIKVEQGCQKYPHTRIQVGAVLYKVDVSEWDDGSTTISVDEWVVRSIKRKHGTQTSMGRRKVGDDYGDTAPLYVNVCAKIQGKTWVKKSKKAGDFGWSNSISQKQRDQFKVGSHLPLGLFTTPLAALRWALKQHEKVLNQSIEERNQETDAKEIAEWDEDIAHTTKSVRLLKSRIKKLTKNKPVKE